jgi:hypothetical protein
MSATVSIYKSAATFSAVTNDVWWILQSTNTSLNNFKYITNLNQIDPVTGTVSSLGTYKFVARPTNNLGYFSVSKPMNSVIDNSYPFYNGVVVNPTVVNNIVSPDLKTFAKYNLNYGYEWNPGLSFSQVLQVSPGNFFGLTFGATHGLSVGDNIFISSYNQYLGGTATVTAILSNTSIEINKSWTNSVAISYGSVTDAQHINGTSSYSYVYNGALDYGQENQYGYAYNNYVFFGTASDTFLTQFNSGKSVLLSNYESLTFLLPDNWTSPFFNIAYQVKTYDINNNLLTTTFITLGILRTYPYSFYNKFVIGSGPINLIAKGVSFTNVYSYQVQFILNSNICATFNYTIDNDCSPFTNTRLVWLNRLGGYDFFNFRQNSQRNETINRKEYKQVLQPYYTTGERGRNLITVDTKEAYTINSNWVSQADYLSLNDLLTSLEAYVVDETTGNLYPIIITDTSYTEKTYLTDKLFNMTLTYELAYDKYIQSN